jgi:hypothetical protein
MQRFSIPRMTRTCRHCGASTDDALRDARVGIVCCRDAVLDQIEWRETDLDRLRAKARREAADAEARARLANADQAERIRKGYQRRLHGVIKAEADALQAELTRLRERLDGVQAELPRPYTDA